MFREHDLNEDDDDDLSMKSPAADHGHHVKELRVDAADSVSESLFNFVTTPISKSSRPSTDSLSNPLSISISPSPAPSPDAGPDAMLIHKPALTLPSLDLFNERKSLEIEVMNTGSLQSEESVAKHGQEIADLKRQLDLEQTRREFWRKKYDEEAGLKKSVLHLKYALDQERKQRIALESKTEFMQSLRESVDPGQQHQECRETQDSAVDLNRYKEIAYKLYTECIHGEGPRWHSVALQSQQRILRDQELADLRTAITSLYPKGMKQVHVSSSTILRKTKLKKASTLSLATWSMTSSEHGVRCKVR